MSELAEQERRVKRRWAIPGGSHDRVVKTLKLALPALIGVILAFLFFAPLEDKQEVSFLLDKNKVETAPERLRVASAQYRGQDDQGRPFVLSARSALQETSANPVVEISDMNAQILLDNGPARLNAGRARYNMDTDHVQVVGPIEFTAADGYRMGTRDVDVDLRGNSLASRGPVEGRIPLGNFSADQLQVNLRDRTVVLNGRARLHIVQRGAR
ncbi:MAG: lipopolysaccharide export system protein LptC [Sphingomonadales bacterium]|jgi:lipopolysaccharide export system protein LptC|nr:lipopolysaccharide export system protein LptC [Sphingomonadales bacterium]MEA3044845.1 lipopolysaccharide export system protein LptC [Sphingomonadales bacterium]MEA3046593.1 lipopolysaccharide export system protein LptC [Sphingomonadales bacterium]